MTPMHRKFASILRDIETHESDYVVRNGLIFSALSIAAILDIPHGIRIDLKEPEWPVAFIELPTGQVSWHLPQHILEWDEHTTETKYRRIRAYVDMVSSDEDNA